MQKNVYRTQYFLMPAFFMVHTVRLYITCLLQNLKSHDFVLFFFFNLFLTTHSHESKVSVK